MSSQAIAESIGAAFDLLPAPVAERLAGVHFFTADPVFSGLHSWDMDPTAQYEGSYRDTAHFCSAFHIERPAADRAPTIVLPVLYRFRPVSVVVHELGHALHFQMDAEHEAVPCTDYAQLNHWEAFAEAFEAWHVPDEVDVRNYLRRHDPATVDLFERLDAGVV